MIKYVLTDLEGTTTSISFVHDVLFPYSARELMDFLKENANNEEVTAAMAQASSTILQETGKSVLPEDTAIALLSWITEDRKHPALKAIQGLIWKTGFENGEFQGHVYDDVLPALQRWKQAGLKIGIYSSGSEEAQRLLVKYSRSGDLSNYIHDYFDTRVGNKRERQSYENIAEELGLQPQEILFLTDVPQEVAAAAGAGMQVLQLHRKDNDKFIKDPNAKQVADFSEINPSDFG